MVEKFLKKLCNKEVILYLIFGVLTTLVDYIVFCIGKDIFNMHYILSTCLAWFFAVLFAYVTNKFFVFSSSKTNNLLREAFMFFVLRLASLLLSIIFMFILVDLININEKLSKFLVNFLVVVVNYIFSKLYIFKK